MQDLFLNVLISVTSEGYASIASFFDRPVNFFDGYAWARARLISCQLPALLFGIMSRHENVTLTP